MSYVEVPRQMEPTGIHVFDAFLQYMSRGESNVKAFADGYGLRHEDLESLVFILTGMRGVDFRIAYHLKAAEELLRFTDLSMAEVARYSGFGSPNNLYLTYKREFNISPGYRRARLQKPGDRGLYKL